MMLDCVIKDATLVMTADGLQRAASASPRADIGIQDGKIAAIGAHLVGRETISAEGMLVIPGGVDPHVHLEMPAGHTITSDTWETGSRAAAFGGTTTVIDFVEPAPGLALAASGLALAPLDWHLQPLLQDYAQRKKQALGACAVDFAFHMTLCAADPATLQQIPGVVGAGMPSFKLYTTYPGFHLDDASLLLALEAIGAAGGLALVHAESDAIIQHATRRLQAAGRLAVGDFPASRPAVAEVEAIERVLSLAQVTGTPVYIVHVSTQGGAAAIARARHAGQPAWGETCPQYLLLDQSQILADGFAGLQVPVRGLALAGQGAKLVCCPPLRKPADQAALWSALQSGDLQSIGTDHCAFNYSGQKDAGRGLALAGRASFLDIPSGLPGIELRLALTYTYGVLPGRITLAQWVDLCCTAPAKIFGLHPQKGELAVGADADIVLFDPNHKTVVTQALLHENVDYTPYEGMALTGMVDTTLLRGQVLVRGGKWEGKAGTGNFVPGTVSSSPRAASASPRAASASPRAASASLNPKDVVSC